MSKSKMSCSESVSQWVTGVGIELSQTLVWTAKKHPVYEILKVNDNEMIISECECQKELYIHHLQSNAEDINWIQLKERDIFALNREFQPTQPAKDKNKKDKKTKKGKKENKMLHSTESCNPPNQLKTKRQKRK